MKLLVDTDAFCKLGVAEFLREMARIFDASLQECGRLPALPYMLKRGALRKQYGARACDALIPIADTMPVMNRPSVTWLDKLTSIDAIDPGEAQIFAAAAESDMIVISGDKRSLRALKGVEGFAEALAGRIVVIEAILLILCDRLGQEPVRRQVAPLVASDNVVRICFSEENLDPRKGLSSYYTALAADVEPLVLWNPQAKVEI
jgi:hypothetical protein